MTEEPVVTKETITTAKMAINLTEGHVIEILKAWATANHGFSHRAQVIDDEYFFRGVVIEETISNRTEEDQ